MPTEAAVTRKEFSSQRIEIAAGHGVREARQDGMLRQADAIADDIPGWVLKAFTSMK